MNSSVFYFLIVCLLILVQRLRSSGLNKVNDPKQMALENLKVMGATAIDPGKPPSPVQAFLGSIAAGAICLILYKFSSTIEASLSRQAISDNFSVSFCSPCLLYVLKNKASCWFNS